MRLIFVFGAVLASFFCKSQNVKPPGGRVEKSTLHGNVYTNGYFGFSVEIDSFWHILNKAQLTQMMNERADILYGSTGNQVAVANGAEILLSLTIDTIETMPHVLFSSLDLKMFPQIKGEMDFLRNYISEIKKMYESYHVQITSSAINEEEIGGRKYFSVLVTIKAENFLAYQKRYSTKIKDRLFNIMANYNSNEYEKRCNNLLKKFIWKVRRG